MTGNFRLPASRETPGYFSVSVPDRHTDRLAPIVKRTRAGPSWADLPVHLTACQASSCRDESTDDAGEEASHGDLNGHDALN